MFTSSRLFQFNNGSETRINVSSSCHTLVLNVLSAEISAARAWLILPLSPRRFPSLSLTVKISALLYAHTCNCRVSRASAAQILLTAIAPVATTLSADSHVAVLVQALDEAVAVSRTQLARGRPREVAAAATVTCRGGEDGLRE